jgi:hypothetical protein
MPPADSTAHVRAFDAVRPLEQLDHLALPGAHPDPFQLVFTPSIIVAVCDP